MLEIPNCQTSSKEGTEWVEAAQETDVCWRHQSQREEPSNPLKLKSQILGLKLRDLGCALLGLVSPSPSISSLHSMSHSGNGGMHSVPLYKLFLNYFTGVTVKRVP